MSLFAYGQTGSGKSHTMFGRGGAPGVVPRFCDALFAGLAASATVTCSVVEIYNEQLRDLLQPPGTRNPAPLKIRDAPATGPYVAGATVSVAKNASELARLVRLGARHRTVAATAMNEASSRAHTVVTVRVARETEDRVKLRKTAIVHLVDLAGSERQKRALSTGARLVEATHINRSLSTLSLVVSALAARDGRHVPYRDAALTHLLRESLGGNARTTMVANIAPGLEDVPETLSAARVDSKRGTSSRGDAAATT